MPLQPPILDDRRFAELREETLARIPVHTPEWTNFNPSDPGVTLVELFAFLAESLIYRANQIPERNRRAFLRLLGVPLQPATSARGIVSFSNARSPLETLTVNDGLELRAGEVPFRTERGLDILPVEGRAYLKRSMPSPADELLQYYNELYASYSQDQLDLTQLQLYETTPLAPGDERGVNIARSTVDGAVWLALIAPSSNLAAARAALAGKTLSLGLVPAVSAPEARLRPGQSRAATAGPTLLYELPLVPADARLPETPDDRVAAYRPLPARPLGDPFSEPTVIELSLPADPNQLRLWEGLGPLEYGVGDFPPVLEDPSLAARLVTWLRIRPASANQASLTLDLSLIWVGVNAALVNQRAEVYDEPLPDGTGEPDQSVSLARAPVLPRSVRLAVGAGQAEQEWDEVDSFAAAGPEVPAADRRAPPGVPAEPPLPAEVYLLDAEAGVLRFGDGYRGKRPPRNAPMRASYHYGAGQSGNVGAGAINAGSALPAGVAVSNPVRSWGGADAERTADGERQVPRYLQHRDRLVTAADYRTVTWRTPGVALGRVEVLPAFHPDLSPNEPGDAPGAVTLLLIPRYDPLQPDAPQPDKLFFDSVCAYLDPRRLVTTELVLRGPTYKGIWISVGIDVVAGASPAVVREEVKAALLQLLAPLPAEPGPEAPGGWPLRKAVANRELLAQANRVGGVLLVNGVLLAEGDGGDVPDVPMRGLELPRVLGVAVSVGEPLSLADLRGGTVRGTGDTGTGADAAARRRRRLPVPTIPEECR